MPSWPPDSAGRPAAPRPAPRVDGQWLYGTGGATKAGISGADALRYEHGILHGDEWAGHGIGSASL